MKKLFILFAVLVFVGAGCSPRQEKIQQEMASDNPKAYGALEDEGYTEIELTGHAILGCGKEDSALTSYHYQAKNTAGKTVDGTVCCGLLLKGCTVRH